MKTHWLTATIVPAVLGLCCLSTAPLRANPPSPLCSNEDRVSPSPERRYVVVRRHDLRFQIPRNYQIIQENEPEVERIIIRNPTDVEFLDCALEHGPRGAGHQVSDLRVEIKPRPSHVERIGDFVDSAVYESGDFVQTRLAGEEAITWIQGFRANYITYNAALLHPDGEHLVHIFVGDYGEVISPQDVDVLEMVMESLAFPRISP
ncbi:MAG: hypothetical protein JJU32_13775 [Phormidium sp. BM_Day4_Bin.17]|nr:hypothetical protein [Phormidium sp. BM_Day4_Bin.17]UCJ13325.1 MAG: hypothetical protein JWS08_06005 [Phormidium sp. PBR-2020]